MSLLPLQELPVPEGGSDRSKALQRRAIGARNWAGGEEPLTRCGGARPPQEEREQGRSRQRDPECGRVRKALKRERWVGLECLDQAVDLFPLRPCHILIGFFSGVRWLHTLERLLTLSGRIELRLESRSLFSRRSLQEPIPGLGVWTASGPLSVHSLHLPYFRPAPLMPAVFHQPNWPPRLHPAHLLLRNSPTL